MAVLTVEVFALQPETDTTLTADEQFTVDLCFTAALATLNDHTGPDTTVISCDVIAYDTGPSSTCSPWPRPPNTSPTWWPNTLKR